MNHLQAAINEAIAKDQDLIKKIVAVRLARLRKGKGSKVVGVFKQVLKKMGILKSY